VNLTIIGTVTSVWSQEHALQKWPQGVCVDNDEAKVKTLKSGGIPIYEPGLEELVTKNTAAGRLSFTTSTAEGVNRRTWCLSRSPRHRCRMAQWTELH